MSDGVIVDGWRDGIKGRLRLEFVVGVRYNLAMSSSVDHWAGVAPEARYFTEVMDELLANTTRSSEELLDRAREMREQAAATDIEGYRKGALRLAKRFEYAAAERLTSA